MTSIPPRSAPADAPDAAWLAHWRHALRGPLNALLAAAQVLEQAPADSEAARQARAIIARQARNLAWVVSALPGEEPPPAT